MTRHPAGHPLFADPAQPSARLEFAPDAVLLRGFAGDIAGNLMAALEPVCAAAPLRHMQTPGGRHMSVANTNAGRLGWVSDREGYRYAPEDPLSGKAWPSMPAAWLHVAHAAALEAGFGRFDPDACLVNVYAPGTRLSLHQDRDERDFDAPIVSVSLGLPATFLFGGATRGTKPRRIPLLHGDVVVWGGISRLAFHGVAPLAEGKHPLTDHQRINLTLRKAG